MAYKRTTSTRKVGPNTTARITTTVSSKGIKRSTSTSSGSKGNRVTNTRNNDGTWTRTVTQNGWVTKSKSPKSAIYGPKPKIPRAKKPTRVSKKQQEQNAMVLLVVGVGFAVVYGFLYLYVTVSEFFKTIFG